MPTASTSDYTKCIWQSIINLLCHSINPHSFPFRSISVLPILHCGLSTGGMRYRGWTLDVNNQTKTERVLTGSRYNKLSLLGDCVPSLQLGCDSIAPSDGVWLLGVTTATDLSTDNCMCQTSVRRVSSGFVIWDVFVDHWTLSQLRHWLTLLLHRGSITAIAFLLLHRRESQTSCSLSMLQHVWSLRLRSTSVFGHGWCMMTCTGWLFLRDCSTSSLWRSIVVFSTDLQYISPTTASSTVCSTGSPQHVCKPCFFCCRTNSLDGIHCQMICGIQMLTPSISGKSWKHLLTGHGALAR